MGQLAAEYGDAAVSGTQYFTVDHLGSTRLLTDNSGNVAERIDYLPFGEGLSGVNGRSSKHPAFNAGAFPADPTDGQSVKFTSKERDAETGLDYFLARYMSSAQGRFTSPDPLMESADPAFPQTWNRYAYGLNNPLRFIDPSGMEAISVEDCQKNPDCVTVKLNVVYDKNAQSFDQKGNVLPEYQKKVDEQIAKAKDEYGNALISFDVSFGTGAIGTKGAVTGVVKDGLNVLVTDSRNTFVGGKSGESGGFAVTFLNAGRSDSGTLAHEIAHHFSGDTQGSRNLLMNVWADVRNDLDRLTLRTTTPIVGPYFGSEHRANRVTAPFNSGARRYFGSR
jgi:RHS repeat-associated protein